MSAFGLAGSTPPTEMQFFAVEGDPSVPTPATPPLPAATVTTMFGLVYRAVSMLPAVVS